ncbi:MAG: helix-turn-helix transcriptional regulator [Clostridia bacterium]|nr:helix-turn-helix transcriptional regulator [Clostridia bacterium]
MKKKNKALLSIIAGDNLREIIKKSRWKTQEKFAEAKCVDVKTVNRWVNGGINRFDLAEELADFIGIDVYSLITKKHK